MGQVMFDTNVFVSYAFNDFGMSAILPIQRYLAVWEIKQAVREYRASLGVLHHTLFSQGAAPPNRAAFRRIVSGYFDPTNDLWPIIERCRAAWETLQNMSDEDWDMNEPELVEEIGVLHELFATDEDLGDG